MHDGRVRTLPGLGALVVAVAIQVGTNYANDYSDFVRGADRRRLGPLRAASSGVVPPAHVRWTAGTTYVHELRVPPAAWAAGCATGFMACAILALNNLRDIDTDAEARKRTLAVRIGRRWTRALIVALLAAALLTGPLAAALGWAPWWVALTLLALPLALLAARAAWSTAPPVLVGGLKRTAELELSWALLWTLGILL